MSRLRTYSAVIIVLCLMPMAAAALEAPTDTQVTQAQTLQDPPRGFPYNTGAYTGNGDATSALSASQVPLRDFLSSRQDQQRAELIERIEAQDRQFQKIIDERDKQYAQRFDAQQEALRSALQAAEKAVVSALNAADRAVAKAEGAADKRFESDDKFRQTLTEQASTFMSKDTAEARFSGLEEKVSSISDRLNATQSRDQGSDSTWVFIIAVVSTLVGIGSLMLHFNKSRLRELEARP